MIDEAAIRSRYDAVRDCLNESGRRLFAAAKRALPVMEGFPPFPAPPKSHEAQSIEA
jgi:hypothetical protein